MLLRYQCGMVEARLGIRPPSLVERTFLFKALTNLAHSGKMAEVEAQSVC